MEQPTRIGEQIQAQINEEMNEQEDGIRAFIPQQDAEQLARAQQIQQPQQPPIHQPRLLAAVVINLDGEEENIYFDDYPVDQPEGQLEEFQLFATPDHLFHPLPVRQLEFELRVAQPYGEHEEIHTNFENRQRDQEDVEPPLLVAIIVSPNGEETYIYLGHPAHARDQREQIVELLDALLQQGYIQADRETRRAFYMGYAEVQRFVHPPGERPIYIYGGAAHHQQERQQLQQSQNPLPVINNLNYQQVFHPENNEQEQQLDAQEQQRQLQNFPPAILADELGMLHERLQMVEREHENLLREAHDVADRLRAVGTVPLYDQYGRLWFGERVVDGGRDGGDMGGDVDKDVAMPEAGVDREQARELFGVGIQEREMEWLGRFMVGGGPDEGAWSERTLQAESH